MRSLTALDAARRELEAATSTADLADPPTPHASLGLLRAAAESVTEDAQIVRDVSREATTRRDPASD